jgi:hypothetical protein
MFAICFGHYVFFDELHFYFRCKRCCSYLGDAVLRADAGNELDENNQSGGLENEYEFRQEEVASMKLLWNKIIIRNNEISNEAPPSIKSIYEEIRLEQVRDSMLTLYGIKYEIYLF